LEEANVGSVSKTSYHHTQEQLEEVIQKEVKKDIEEYIQEENLRVQHEPNRFSSIVMDAQYSRPQCHGSAAANCTTTFMLTNNNCIIHQEHIDRKCMKNHPKDIKIKDKATTNAGLKVIAE
jgi:hypothetical protein